MLTFNHTFILRVAVSIILLTHSVPGMFDGGINAFGNFFLNEKGFAPFGVAIAWVIKLSHVACVILFLLNKFVKPAAILTIFILIMGIALVHLKDGWFVVGGGRNGVEYNFLLISVLLAILFPDGMGRKKIN